MELEKTLFRVHERLLTDTYSKKITFIAMIISYLLSLASLTIFIIANILYEGKSSCFPAPTEDNIYHFVIPENNLTFIVAQQRELLTMNQTLIDKHNFTIREIQIKKQCLFLIGFFEVVIDLENLIINDIVWSDFGKSDLFIKNNSTKEIFAWNAYILSTYRRSGFSLLRRFQEALIQLFKIILALFIQCGITSLYIKMTIICAPIFILMLLFVISRFGNRDIQFNIIYRAFPWIGVYLNILDLNNRSKASLIMSFFLMLMFFYFVYLSSIFVGSMLLFEKALPKGIDESVFGFMALVEFAAILFFRTRTTIYYAPKFIIGYYIIYLFYVQYSLFGFFLLGFQCMLFMSLFTVLWFLYYLEIPSLSWSPISPYTPCLDRPRCLYLPLFSLAWVNDLPHIWTMFYPLHGRRFFNLNNLALVDRNFLLLNNQLIQDNNEIEMNIVEPAAVEQVAEVAQPAQHAVIQIDVDQAPEGQELYEGLIHQDFKKFSYREQHRQQEAGDQQIKYSSIK